MRYVFGTRTGHGPGRAGRPDSQRHKSGFDRGPSLRRSGRCSNTRCLVFRAFFPIDRAWRNSLPLNFKRPILLRLGVLLTFAAVVFTGCVSTPPYVYRYIPGRTATLDNGYALAPPNAPLLVREAIDAGNALVGLPY